jgi:conjugal transfer mating pair stabilization protein TraG
MVQQLSIVAYGNGDILREMFNAIAASMGDSSYKTLIHLTLALAGSWMILQMVAKRSLMVSVHWIGLYFLAFYVLFLPKATIHIIDRVEQSKVYTVDNVPLGLAILASYTTIIGDSLTQEIEKNFSMPDDLHYSQTGMVMASQLVTAASTFQITDPVFQENMQDFINQCVFYDLLLNKYSAQDLLTTPNIWQFVTQNASPARAFLYNHTVTTCQEGVTALNQDWQTAIDAAGDRYGARLFPNSHSAKSQLLKYLPISYSYLTNLSDGASSLIQQNMMANAIQNGVLGWSARSNAPAALSSYAFNKAQQQTRIGNRTVGDLAAYWLPLMKNLFEGILYGSFIFIFLLVLFPFGGMVLRNYLYSLIWLQMWAPLYAIINLYVGFYAQYRSVGAIARWDQTQPVYPYPPSRVWRRSMPIWQDWRVIFPSVFPLLPQG